MTAPHQPDTEREAFCCEHSFKAAKDEAWRTRPLRECRCDHCEYCLKCLPAEFRAGGFWDVGHQPQLTAAQAQIARLEAERDELKLAHDAMVDALLDEIVENFRLRDIGGALPNEDMPTFIARVFRERDEARATVARLERALRDLRDHTDVTQNQAVWISDALSATAKPQEGA